ncbi:MAG: thioesterase family protein [Deltaproteobacteria bacterium]|nr:thioesterase family protein [Deltaproteobacteria bacterium]
MRPRINDFDLQGVLNSKQYMDLVAEARIEQMQRYYKVPIETYFKRNQTWILSRFLIHFARPIRFYSSFFIHTQVARIEGPKSVVKFDFVSLDKKTTHASGEVDYYLLDLSTWKPVSMPENERLVFLEERSV